MARSPTLCGVCTNEQRNNQDVLAKASYFLSTSKTGSHNLVAGADVFKDYRYSNNHQSGSDFTVASPRSIQVGNDFYPVLTNDGLTLITYRPILVPTKGTNIWTYSAFFNDAWRLNNHVSFNLGIRGDRNRSIDGSGAEVAKDSMFSPRLSATWDPRGDGKTTFFTSYARYVASIANSIADAGSAGGVPAAFQWVYRGPTVNTEGPVLLPDAALPILFAWWDAQGGANNPNLNGVSIPGLSTRVGAGLKAGYMTEYLAGMSHNFGRVLVRVDASYRPASNFYGNFTNLELGRVTHQPTGLTADVTEVRNTDSVWRKYWGVNGQFSWRPRRDLTVGGNWTISRNRGNVEGENAGSGPIRATVDQYPEYKAAAWNYPVGDLSSDQRHRGRFYANYDRRLGPFGSLGIAVLQMINNGVPYGAVAGIDMRRYVANPGYATAQGGSTVNYSFTARDAYRLPRVYRTDLSLNYSYRFGRRYEVFWQGQVLNVLDATGLATLGNINTTVMTADVPGSITGLQRFNAFTTEPVQGVNWALDPGTTNRDGHGNPVPFGQALAYAAYQTPRTFRTSFEFRF